MSPSSHSVPAPRPSRRARRNSAADALRRAIEEKPDAILSAISMPREDGYSFVRSLRGRDDPAVRTIRAAALTALARGEERQRALAAGFNEHFAKPVEPAELVALVRRLWSPSQA